MGATSDATLTPRTLELSAVLDCLSFDFSSQNTMADEVVTCDETVPEEDLMPLFDVTQTLYCAVKDVWANGKHIPVICSLLTSPKRWPRNSSIKLLRIWWSWYERNGPP